MAVNVEIELPTAFDLFAEDALRVGLWSEAACDVLTDAIANGIHSEDDVVEQWQASLSCLKELQTGERSTLAASIACENAA